MKIHAHNQNSGSVRRLREHLDDFKTNTTLNWGSGVAWATAGSVVLNRETSAATSKREALRRFNMFDVPTVRWTSSCEKATEWGKEHTILARSDFLSNSNGLIICDPGSKLPNKDFYSVFIEGMQDFRIHVFGGDVIECQIKVGDKLLIPKPEERNAFVPDNKLRVMSRCAVRAISALNLDFGAVDFGVCQDGFVVYEVNTAPSIGDQMAANYAATIKRYCRKGTSQF